MIRNEIEDIISLKKFERENEKSEFSKIYVYSLYTQFTRKSHPLNLVLLLRFSIRRRFTKRRTNLAFKDVFKP